MNAIHDRHPITLKAFIQSLLEECTCKYFIIHFRCLKLFSMLQNFKIAFLINSFDFPTPRFEISIYEEAKELLEELKSHFPAHAITNVFGIVYFHF